MSNQSSPKPSFVVGGESYGRVEVYENLDQEVIITTTDKVKLCLIEHRRALRAQWDWVTPLGILISLIPSLVAADFQNKGFKAETWEAIFIVASIVSGIWLVCTVIQSLVTLAKRTGRIDNIIQKLQQGLPNTHKPTLPAVESEGELVIHSARYGAKGQWKDVTEFLKSKVSGGKLQIVVSNTELGGDPIKGTEKALEVHYSYDGKEQSIKIREYGNLSLP